MSDGPDLGFLGETESGDSTEESSGGRGGGTGSRRSGVYLNTRYGTTYIEYGDGCCRCDRMEIGVLVMGQTRDERPPDTDFWRVCPDHFKEKAEELWPDHNRGKKPEFIDMREQ